MRGTSFDEMGFLSDEMQGVISKIRARYEFWFEKINFINKACQKFQYDLEVNKKNLQEIVMAPLFARMLSNFQAAVILAERGMEPQAMAAARNTLESFYWLKACSLDEKNVQEYLGQVQLDRKKVLERHLRKNGEDTKWRKLLDEVIRNIHEKKIKKIVIRDLAEKVGMLDWHESTYLFMSGSTHSSAKDMEIHHLVKVERGTFELKNEFSDKYLTLIFKTLLDTMLNALQIMEGVFKARVDFSIEELRSTTDKQYLSQNPTT